MRSRGRVRVRGTWGRGAPWTGAKVIPAASLFVVHTVYLFILHSVFFCPRRMCHAGTGIAAAGRSTVSWVPVGDEGFDSAELYRTVLYSEVRLY
jgi:hypothetical protein